MNDMFRNLMDNVVKDNVNTARDRAAWEGASAVEQATFGKVFNAIEGIIGLVALFGCFFISNAMANNQFMLYLCGFLWVLPFIAVGGLLARFRHAVFGRLRGVINGFLGGR
jgi:hypothetical protein